MPTERIKNYLGEKITFTKNAKGVLKNQLPIVKAVLLKIPEVVLLALSLNCVSTIPG
jgi:hypothetical protein